LRKRGETIVLVVDDEPDILELLEEEFKYVGFMVRKAISGNDAVKILQKEKIDIVVSDFKMPNGSGMVVLDAVNKFDAASRPLFYFVSGEADVSIDDAISAGARKFYAKPFDLEKLIIDIGTDAGVEMTGFGK